LKINTLNFNHNFNKISFNARKSTISQSNKEEMIKLYSNGMSLEAIGKKLGYSASTVGRIINLQENIDELKKEHKNNSKYFQSFLDEEKIKKAEALYRSGLSYNKSAQKLNVSYFPIQKKLSKSENYNEIKQEHEKNSKTTGKRLTKEQKEEAIELYKSGMNRTKIAEYFECSKTPINNLIDFHPDTYNIIKIHKQNLHQFNQSQDNENN